MAIAGVRHSSAMSRERHKEPNLYPSYALFQASASAADILILVFAAKFLTSNTGHLGLLDAVSTFGYTFAALAFGLLARHLAPSRPILASGLLLTALSILFFAFSSTLWIAFTLAIMVGIFTAMPNSTFPWYLCLRTPRSRWGEIYGKLSTAGAIGGSVGLVFAVGWLTLTQNWRWPGSGEAYLFLILGITAAVGALLTWRSAGRAQKQTGVLVPHLSHMPHLPHLSIPSLLHTLKSPFPPATRLHHTPSVQASSTAVFRGGWVVYFLLPGLLFFGLGMSATGTLLYVIKELGIPGPGLFVFVFLFRIASMLTSSPTGHVVGRFTPLRMNQMAGVVRFSGVMALSLVALLPTGPWSLPMAGLLFLLCGASWGAMNVTSMATATDLVPSRHQGMALFLFNGVSNGGAGLGAWLAGVIAQELGFSAVLAISALLVGIALRLWQRY